MSELDYSKLASENSADCVFVEDDLLSDTDESCPGLLAAVPVCIDGDNRVWAKAGVFSPLGEVISKNVSECFPNETNPAFQSISENDSTTVEEIEVSDIDEQGESSILDVTFLGSNSVITVKAAAPPVSSGDGTFRCRNFPGNEIFADNQKSGVKRRNVKSNNCTKVYEDSSHFVGMLPKVRGKNKEMREKISKVAQVSDGFYSVIKSDKIPHKYQSSTEPQSSDLPKDSEGSDTDTEEIVFMEDELGSLVMNGAFNCVSGEKDTGDNSVFEIFSDDECTDNKTYKKKKASNDHETDEEDLDTLLPLQNAIFKNHNKEFMEYDESGGIKQVTKVKTETSVKVVEGDADQGDGDDIMSSTTTRTTTRIITTVTTQGGEQEVTEQQDEGTGDLRSSMEAVLTQFMSSDESSDQKSDTKHD